MLVHVLSQDGKPLMPCHPAKARILLKEGKAKPMKTRISAIIIVLTLLVSSTVVMATSIIANDDFT